MLPPEAQIIDIACGPGNVTNFMYQCRNDLRIECVDIAPAMIELVQEKFPDITCHVCDVKDFKFTVNYYNGMICSFGLPFLTGKETELFFNNMSNGLKKNGVVYVSTMKGSSEGYEKTSFSSETEVYFIYHTKEFLDTIIKANGLKVIEYQEQLFPQENA